MLCKEDSEEVTTKYHLLQVKPSFGEDTAQAMASSDSASGDQQAKRVEVKKEGMRSQERTRQSCDGARNTASENKQRRRPFFLRAGHMVTLNAQKMTDFAGSPLAGNTFGIVEQCCQHVTAIERRTHLTFAITRIFDLH